jgi:AraC-like DNA-binding protein
MLQNMILRTRGQDLVPIFSGHEVCERGHKYGPHTRDYYLVHFCLKGKGELADKLGRHAVHRGELFIIRPGEITTYEADKHDPWEYSWIAFEGTLADVFDTGCSVYPFPTAIGFAVRELSLEGVNTPMAFLPLLYELIWRLFGEKQEKVSLPEQIKQYISFNYMDELSVLSISDYFGFERSYLYRIFKRDTGMGIKEYVTQTRMKHAKALLEKGYSVGATALAVGYKEQSNFSKTFTTHFGFAPKTARGREEIS